jgi:hypothetical protein
MDRKLPSNTGLQRVVLASIAAVASAFSMASVGGLAEHYAAAMPGAASADRYAAAAPNAGTADRYAFATPGVGSPGAVSLVQVAPR